MLTFRKAQETDIERIWEIYLENADIITEYAVRLIRKLFITKNITAQNIPIQVF